MHGLSNRPCHCQFAPLDCNLSNLIDAGIESFRVFVWWIHCNWLRLTWSQTRLPVGWPGINPELSLLLLTSHGCTSQASLLLQSVSVKSGRFLLLRHRDASLANSRLLSVRNRLCYRQAQFNRHVKTLCWCDQCSQICMMGRVYHDASERVFHEILYAKRIWNCMSDNSVKAYARVSPHRKVYQ